MIGDIFQHADLQEMCSPGERPRRATVERWARKSGIRFLYDSQGGLITTIQAVNFAMGVPQDLPKDAPLSPDDLF